MRILVVHNYYRQRGGEDVVFEHETELLRQCGVAVETVAFQNEEIRSPLDRVRTGVAAFHNAASALVLRRSLAEFKPDVVHAHNLFPVASPSVLGEARRAGIPVVATLHNYRLICANALLFRDGHVCEECVAKVLPLNGIVHRCYRHSTVESALVAGVTTGHRWLGTWRSVDRFIALSEFARRKILESRIGIRSEQIVVKPNSTTDRGWSETEPRERFVLYLGRLSEEKGLLPLLEAAQRHGFPLKIAGGGPLEPVVRAAVTESANIEYVGFLGAEAVNALLRRARALVFPSVWLETFGMTIVEALSTGTPVVASRIGGIPDIVQHGFNGLLAEPDSVDSIAEQVRLVLSDEQLHRSLSANARASYLARYTPEVNYRSLMALYEGLRAQSQRNH